MPLLVHHFSTLYCTFTNENWSTLLGLVFLAYLFRQLLPAAAVFKSSAQGLFFWCFFFLVRVGGKKRFGNDHSEFGH